MRTIAILTTFSVLALSGAAFADDFAGNDWSFDYAGHYSVVGVDGSNETVLQGLLGGSIDLAGQLNLLNGNVSADHEPISMSQSAAGSITAGDLQFDATSSSHLLPALGGFLYDLLNASNGQYDGAVSGPSTTFTRACAGTLELDGLVDTRLLGTGVVLDLRASIPNSVLNGAVVLDGGPDGTYGPRALTIEGASGAMSTIQLSADVKTYLLGKSISDTGFVNVAAIEDDADSWSMSRPGTPAPEPASFAALAVGALGLLARRRRRA